MVLLDKQFYTLLHGELMLSLLILINLKFNFKVIFRFLFSWHWMIFKFLRFRFLVLFFVFLSIIKPSFADPFSLGDVVLGEKLHNQICKNCHDGMVPGGNGNELYLSELRAISTSSKLISQVEFCANQSGATWFEEEIVSVSKFLNDNFYKFSD